MGGAITITGAARALRDGSTTSVALTRRALAQADALDARLGVYLTRFDEYALGRAEAADRDLAAGIDRGPMHGIPIGIKDIVAMAEGPTTAQSLVLDPEWGAGRDAIVVERLKAAGAVITGKLTTMEFACGIPDHDKPFPIPRNPWNPERYAGGSSSGSGSGVASGMMLGAVGTDTAGSIRLPAIFCGVSGLKPTFGRVPNAGCTPMGYSMDHVGPLARSARDCAVFLQAIAGGDERDPYAVDLPVPDFLASAHGSLAGVRVGVARDLFGPGDDPAVRPAFEAAIAVLATLGATVVEIVLPLYDEMSAAAFLIQTCEGMAYHLPDLRSRWTDYFAGSRRLLGLGALFSGADYVQAQRARRVAQRELAALFTGVDVIATPGASQAATLLSRMEKEGAASLIGVLHTAYWNAVGNPALTVPMGFNAEGLPLSLQLGARPFDETLLVQVGDAYQQATDWHLIIPPLATGAHHR
ncbi:MULTISPECIES: amidase [unclassified Sphingomonas]|uniref:amidase n=1 Tax=unclassified Sphingomonas TaxID=196159 RepID=UPI0006F2C7D9|nr:MULTISPECIES: amidase [unclassified Sphingomonas]KQX19717.1 amidase [Sphingomonas sp. Root1294]KQY65918.1 amidase [Sphingomonas sp. Root50]KRB95515.1 amidase [Sphingomonas sp. Root720]